MKRISYICLCLLFLLACNSNKPEELSKDELHAVEPKCEIAYAQGFELEFFEEGVLISISQAWKGMEEPMLFWIPQNEESGYLNGAHYIPPQIDRIACLSTTHLHAFELLNNAGLVIGVADPKLVYSAFYRDRIEQGQINQIALNQEINYEELLTNEPDLLLVYGIGDAVLPKLQKLESLEIPYLLIGEYMEQHPLGQAEWIKVMGLVTGKLDEADSIFSQIEANYLGLEGAIPVNPTIPTVLLNSPWEGVWYLPASENFSTHFIEDAGAQLLFTDSNEEGWQTLDKEYVYENAHDADYWLNTGVHQSLDELVAQFPLAREFQAFQSGQVFNNVKRLGPGGGNDYWESGIYRPDIVLKDLFNIFHSDSLDASQLFYFKPL